MMKFLDGPCAGASLNLQRCPILLRVTSKPKPNARCGTGNAGLQFDALDQLGDTALPEETIYVYILHKKEGSAFVDGRDPKTGKRFGYVAQVGVYRFYEDRPDDEGGDKGFPGAVQPPDEVMRDNAKWMEWCKGQAKLV
ncbi:MAG TPA: hypothetical protein VNH18_20770, partial [Bryobacteraceae bacterium]|nr:hypothetical protein [Bryobacteraceae bacterium]